MLVDTRDCPLYEAFLTSSKAAASTTISVTSPSPALPTAFSIFGATLPTAANTPSSAQLGAGGHGHSTVGYGTKTGPNGRHVMQLVAHASLDVVEDVQWTNGGMCVSSPASQAFALLWD